MSEKYHYKYETKVFLKDISEIINLSFVLPQKSVPLL